MSEQILQSIYDLTKMNKDDLISFIYSSQNPKKYIASFSILIKQFEQRTNLSNQYLSYSQVNDFK